MSGEHHDHSKTYWIMAIVLAVATAIEVAILEVALPPGLMLTGMYLLAVFKFGLVVAYFMHLKYDNKLLTGIFFSGFAIALGTTFAMLALINYQPTKIAINVKDSQQLKALTQGNPENGAAVFTAKGCAACHKISSLPGAVGAVGPALDGMSQRTADQLAGKEVNAYIRESIENPNGYIVAGYPAGLMPAGLRQSMTDSEYNDLVAYLAQL